MSERENLLAQAEALQRTPKPPRTPQRTRVGSAMLRYLSAEAERERRPRRGDKQTKRDA